MGLTTGRILALAGGLISGVFGLIDDQVNADIDYGTFMNPSAIVRPRFRYWLPDPSVDVDTVKADIKANGKIGAGGVEFLPFYGYGGSMSAEPTGANWAEGNFGTPEFLDMFEASLEAHKENGLKMDFAMGPNQGQGVPASTDNEGLQWDLVPYTEAVPENGAFEGIVPGWGVGDLVAVVSAEVLSSNNHTLQLSSSFTGSVTNVTYIEYLLKSGTLVQQTKKLDLATGQISISLKSTNESSSYRLFAFYQRLTLHKNLEFPVTENDTTFDNGSYIVDHYSGKGAEVTTAFWEKYILNDRIKSLLTEVGNYGWEDSVEMTNNISWSKSLPDRFERLMGYSIHSILPFIAFGQNNIGIQGSSPGSFKCSLDNGEEATGYINDFHAVLQDGYREYLQTMVNWTNTVLGLQLSAQPSYNLPMDMMATIPDVNAPECESLGFVNDIEYYRQFSGAANLAGKRVISNEMGAEGLKAFQYPIPRLLWSTKRAFVGGINQCVIHGQAFSGSYYGTTWPGYVPWQYIFSESWNQKQPVWEHGLSDAMGYLARTQQILQTGVPKVDLALFWKISATTFDQSYNTTALTEAGWSYQYISSENFALPQAVVQDGVLAPDGPSWKAIIVPSSQNLTVAAVEKLTEYAAAGLPVIFTDGKPGLYATNDSADSVGFSSKLTALLNEANVHQTTWTGLVAALSDLHITSKIATNTNGTIYTSWRESSKVDYAYIYSDAVASSGDVTIQTTKKPYWFDAWTGERSPVLIYTETEAGIIIPVNLAESQSVMLAFSDDLSSEIATPSFHITKASSNIIGTEFQGGSSIEIKIAASNETGVLTTSTGKTSMISAKDIPDPFSLSKWTLVAEQWNAPANMSDQTIIAAKTNATFELAKLQSWLDIPELVNASGVGYYTTTFSWPPSGSKSTSDLGAFVTINKVLNTARLSVNGQQAPALDVTNAVLDISDYLVKGENKLEIIVPTVMWNNLRNILSSVKNAGGTPLLLAMGLPMSEFPAVDVGLVDEVVVTPFKKVAIKG